MAPHASSPFDCRRLRRLVSIGCVGVLAPRASAVQHWLAGKSPHFQMYSDESDAESRRILTSLEEFRANFLHLIPLKGASEPRTTIIVFDRDSDFRAYKPLYQGKPKELAGYFIPDLDEVTIAMTTDIPNPEADPREVIYHEYVHLLLNARKAEFPPWLDEGLAEVFSTFKVAGGKVEYGEPKMSHVAYLQQSEWLPLAHLFAVTHESPDYNEDSRMGVFYAESWALTHYLLFNADKANAGKINPFLSRMDHGGDSATSLREVYGVDPEAEQSLLRSYLRGGGYYKNRSPAVAQNIPVAFRPATDLERDCALLNLRWRVRQNADAGVAAYALLKRDPHQPRPHELLAAVAAASGDLESAQSHWQKAAELNSDNPWVYLQLLREVLNAYQGATMLDARLPAEQIAPWRAWASRALDLSPQNHDAIEDALSVEAIADRIDIGVANRGQGLAMTMHDPARALLALAVIHWRLGQLQSARRLVDAVEAQPKADLVARDTADELRSRFPAEAPPAGPGVPAPDAARNGSLALGAGRGGEAATLLDRLLAERGTTAVRLKLNPLEVRAGGDVQNGRWQRVEDLREKAQAGDADAMFAVALAYACGDGGEFSPELARDWLQRAVEHGHAIPEAGFAPGPMDPAAVVAFLRAKAPAGEGERLPPMDSDLAARIAQAAVAGQRSPPVVVYRMAPRFPKEVRQSGKKGLARVWLRIGVDGHPAEVRAAEYSDPAAAAAAEACIREWRFIPTIRDGQPIGTLAEITVTFQT